MTIDTTKENYPLFSQDENERKVQFSQDKPHRMTNREWLASLSDKELAFKLIGERRCSFCYFKEGSEKCLSSHCENGVIYWLNMKRIVRKY